jgi:cation transport regulator ChaB
LRELGEIRPESAQDLAQDFIQQTWDEYKDKQKQMADSDDIDHLHLKKLGLELNHLSGIL